MDADHTPKTSKYINANNPLLIQSYFDGEVTSDAFGGMPDEMIRQTQEYQALDELRRVVRLDMETELDRIDSYALLDAINQAIDADETSQTHPASHSPLRPSRRTSSTAASHIVRWLPTFIGAALFLLSIPGFVLWFQADDTNAQPQTVVYINDPAAVQKTQQPKSQLWMDHAQEAHVVGVPTTSKEQLTIEELDFALRKLADRLESLEKASGHPVEHTDADLRLGGAGTDKL